MIVKRTASHTLFPNDVKAAERRLHVITANANHKVTRKVPSQKNNKRANWITQATEIEVFYNSHDRPGEILFDCFTNCLFWCPADLTSQRFIYDKGLMKVCIIICRVHHRKIRLLKITACNQLHFHGLYKIKINGHCV